jgi:hypothetical protein
MATIIALLAALAPASPTIADDAPPTQPKSAQKSQPSELDKQLLEGLGGELLDGLDLPPVKPTSPAPEPQPKPVDPQPPQPGPSDDGSGKPPALRDELDGEDIDLAGQADNPIIDLGRRMKTIERLIAERNTSKPTQQMQQQVVADLTQLIDQIRQQKKRQGGGSRRPRSRAGQPSGQPGEQESRDPAEDSQSRVGQSDQPKAETRDLENLLKEVWGHLPERVRQQMLSGSAEEVLPKYQKLIEEYYKRLAEDAAQNP